MAQCVRDPRQDPPLLRRGAQRAGETDPRLQTVRFSLGRGFSDVELRQGTESLVLEPSSIHSADGGGYSFVENGSEEGPRAALRYRGQRRRVRRRFDSYSPADRPKDDLRRDSPDLARGNAVAF